MSYISIVIPTFNSEKTIERCLATILEQSFTDYEIIIQDGQSTDNTLAIISKFKDSRIRIFSEKDSGVYDAMNKSMLRTKGEWLYFLGSDDSLYDSNVLETVYRKLIITTASVVYGNVKLIGERGVLKGDINNLYKGFTPVEELFTNNICHQAIFYKSSDLKASNLYYELKYPVQADHILNIKMSSLFEFEYIPEVISNFQHGGLSSNVTDPNFSDDLGIVIIRYFGKALKNKKFFRYKSVIKKAARQELRNGNIMSSIKGYIIYLNLKFK